MCTALSRRGWALMACVIVLSLAQVRPACAEPLHPAMADRLPSSELALRAGSALSSANTHFVGTVSERVVEVEDANGYEPGSMRVGSLEMALMGFVIPPVINLVETQKPGTPTLKPQGSQSDDNAHTSDSPSTDGSTPPSPPDAPEPASLILGLLGCGIGGALGALRRRGH